MTGYHEVKLFAIAANSKLPPTLILPNSWKPFSTIVRGDNFYIVARRWHRDGS